LPVRPADGDDRCRPYLGVEAFCGVEGRCGITLGVDDTIDPDPRLEVLAEQIPLWPAGHLARAYPVAGRRSNYRWPPPRSGHGAGPADLPRPRTRNPAAGPAVRRPRCQRCWRPPCPAPCRIGRQAGTPSAAGGASLQTGEGKGPPPGTAICTLSSALGGLCRGHPERRTGMARRGVSNRGKMRNTRDLPGGACSSMVRAGRS
jgi:hypothetical protein